MRMGYARLDAEQILLGLVSFLTSSQQYHSQNTRPPAAAVSWKTPWTSSMQVFALETSNLTCEEIHFRTSRMYILQGYLMNTARIGHDTWVTWRR
jgi:hypothetical protein